MQCDITATGCTTCCHYVVAQLMDISTGERYIYGCVMLHALMVQHRIPIQVVWYDINCRFRNFFESWAAGVGALAAVIAALAPVFPLPCMHKYGHRCGAQWQACRTSRAFWGSWPRLHV